MSIHKVPKEVERLQSELKLQQQLYSEGLKTDVEFEKLKAIYIKMKELEMLLEEKKVNRYITLNEKNITIKQIEGNEICH